jgi:hypothetical protein
MLVGRAFVALTIEALAWIVVDTATLAPLQCHRLCASETKIANV